METNNNQLEIEVPAIKSTRVITINVRYYGNDFRKSIAPYVEDGMYETRWDDDTKQWVMSPKDLTECEVCRGSGSLHLPYEDESTCYGCNGSGEVRSKVDTSETITCADYMSIQRQRKKLEQRYGHPRPSSIRDYWMK